MFDQALDEMKRTWKTEVMAEIKSVLETEQRYLTIADTAKYLSCSYEMIRTLGAAGAFPVIALGTQKRVVDRRDIDAYVASLKRRQPELATPAPMLVEKRAA